MCSVAHGDRKAMISLPAVLFARAAITKHHKLGDLKNQNVLLRSSGDGNPNRSVCGIGSC